MFSKGAAAKAQRLLRKNQPGRAVEFLRPVCQRHPRSAPLRFILANALCLSGQVSQATELLFDLFEDGYRQPIVLDSLGLSLLKEGRASEAIASFRAALSQDPHLLSARSNLLFALCSVDDADPQALFQEHRAFGDLFPVPAAVTSQRRPGRIRVGFLCAWFSFHTVGRFSLPAVQGLDRNRFEVYCYYSGLDSDALTKKFQASADHWRDIAQLNDDQATRQIRDDDIDILIEMDGHTGGNRLPVIARKPARKIVSWLGYMNTTGLPAVDYRIVDRLSDPEPFASAVHAETLIKLDPPFIVFSAPQTSPPVSPLPAAVNGHVTFGAFGQILKHSDSAVAAIGRVLHAVPNSRLMIRNSVCRDNRVQETIVSRFASLGLPAGRIDCAAAGNYREYLKSHHQVDIMLDMFPFNGCTTTCESLWMGVPMVTQAGRYHRERVGSSLLTAAGYPELIATTVDGYIEIAQTLAHDLTRLAKMRAGMRAQMRSSPLMDAPAFISRFQEALLCIVNDRLAKVDFSDRIERSGGRTPTLLPVELR